jgi:hypothetical protein
VIDVIAPTTPTSTAIGIAAEETKLKKFSSARVHRVVGHVNSKSSSSWEGSPAQR